MTVPRASASPRFNATCAPAFALPQQRDGERRGPCPLLDDRRALVGRTVVDGDELVRQARLRGERCQRVRQIARVVVDRHHDGHVDGIAAVASTSRSTRNVPAAIASRVSRSMSANDGRCRRRPRRKRSRAVRSASQIAAAVQRIRLEVVALRPLVPRVDEQQARRAFVPAPRLLERVRRPRSEQRRCAACRRSCRRSGVARCCPTSASRRGTSRNAGRGRSR